MAVYLITYDLNSTGQKYEEVIQTIKDAATAYCSYWKSSYLIKSSLTANQIVDKIKPHLDNNDKLIVVEAKTSNYQGWLSKEQWKFINENIFN